jgi:hypothetical protein
MAVTIASRSITVFAFAVITMAVLSLKIKTAIKTVL